MVLDISRISELKKQLSDKFGVHLHMHDACGAQSFSFDSPADDEVRAFAAEYISEQGGKAVFSPDGKSLLIK